jgi:tRNA G18 (ribose-2'-O)-methylase SpoU
MKIKRLASGKYSITDVSEEQYQSLLDAAQLAAAYVQDQSAPLREGKVDAEALGAKLDRIQEFANLGAILRP